MTYANTLEAINILMKSRQLLSNPDIWCQGEDPNGNVFTLCGALNEVGMDDAVSLKNQDGEGVYPGDYHCHDCKLEVYYVSGLGDACQCRLWGFGSSTTLK